MHAVDISLNSGATFNDICLGGKMSVFDSKLIQRLQKNKYMQKSMRDLNRFVEENKFELIHASQNITVMTLLDWLVTGTPRVLGRIYPEGFWIYQALLNAVIRPSPIYAVAAYRYKKKKPLKLAKSFEAHLYSMPWLDILWNVMEGNGIVRNIWFPPESELPIEIFILIFVVPGIALHYRKPITGAVYTGLKKIKKCVYDIAEKISSNIRWQKIFSLLCMHVEMQHNDVDLTYAHFSKVLH
jgi:hypothetical protein